VSLKHVYAWEGRHEAGERSLAEPQRHLRHASPVKRALSRRQAIRTMAGATGLVLGSGALMPMLAQAASGADPRPIPGGIQPFGPGTELFHIVLPGPGAEPSLITDFNGFVARANIGGTGTGTDATGKTPLLFDVDAGFMQGEYVGVDGRVHRGAFSFI
jgi:hypothetical protein